MECAQRVSFGFSSDVVFAYFIIFARETPSFASWGELTRQLAYKSAWYGKNIR